MLKNLKEQLAAKRDELQAIFASYDDGVGGLKEMPQAVIEDVRNRNTELTDLGAKVKDAESLDQIRRENATEREAFTKAAGIVPFAMRSVDADEIRVVSSLGESFVKSAEYAEFKARGGARTRQELGVELKTDMTTAAGYIQEDQRTGLTVFTGTRPVRLLDLMPNTGTTIDTPRWMEETTFTNNAAAVAEAGEKPESALAYTERSQPCEVIATTLPVTEQQLDVDSMIMSMINNRLTVQLQLEREDQVLNGDGNTPNLLGYLNKPSIQTQAKGTDNTPTAIHKAMTKVRWTGYAEPTAIVIHPNDWEQIRTLQDSTGAFIWGAPSVVGPMTIWGMQVVISNLITEGTALTGDFRTYSELFNRWGVRIDIGYVDDDFRRNRRTIRIESRDCLAIYRATAFCTVTGI